MAALLKRTYSLPAETLKSFETAVEVGQRSSMVAKLMRDWLEEAARRRLREQIVIGCREMASEYQAVEQEYHPLEEEVERVISERSPSRRRRTSSSGSGRRVGAGR